MSEQPPRASGQTPLPGTAEPHKAAFEVDPEAPDAGSAAPRDEPGRDRAPREAAARDAAARELAPRDGGPRDVPPRDAYGFPHLNADELDEPDAEERVRTRASEGLDRAADAARRLGHQARDQGGVAGRAEPIAYRVGDSLQSAASYVRAHDLYDMREDVEDSVHRSPLKALAVAAIGGFLLGRLFR